MIIKVVGCYFRMRVKKRFACRDAREKAELLCGRYT
jgi:hypothetical protein